MAIPHRTARAACIAAGVIALSLGGSALAGPGNAKTPAVLELFTSQGCSSCPPADELLEQLAGEPGIIALSLPVDYWDTLGWRDTLANPLFSARQRAYARARGDGEVYTPQIVVNGQEHAIGSSRSAITRLIGGAAPEPDVPVTLERSADGLRVRVAAVGQDSRSPAAVILLPILASRAVTIGRGENANRKVKYVNVVRDVVSLGSWSGAAIDISVPAAQIKGADGFVVLVQAGSVKQPGAIIGAAHLAR